MLLTGIENPMSLELHFNLQRKGFALNARLNLPGQGVTAIFGRSGSGKTTLLRCIAGLEHQPDGTLIVEGKTWQQDHFFLPVHRRPLGYVFQEASLFPHLRILQNLQYGQKRSQKRSQTRPLVTLDEVVDLFGLSSLLTRYPDQLSGGQRQRVALARALLTSPELLLMDEPLAALDLASKDEILPFIEKLRDQLQLPILYVSHSIEEVARLADHLVVLEQGQVTAEGPLQQLLTDPTLPFIRTETASTVLLGQTRQANAGDGLSQIDIEGQPLLISQRANLQGGQPTRIRILARDVVLATRRPTAVSLLNCLDVQVLDLQDDPIPSQQLVRLQLGQQTLLSRISRRSAQQLQLAPGQSIHALIKGAALN